MAHAAAASDGRPGQGGRASPSAREARPHDAYRSGHRRHGLHRRAARARAAGRRLERARARAHPPQAARPPVGRPHRGGRGRRRRHRRGDGGAAGHRRRLLPRAQPRHRPPLRAARPGAGPQLRARRASRPRQAAGLPRRPLPRRRRPVAPPGLAQGGRGDPARLRRADGGAAGRGDHRVGLGVVRDAALPHRAAPGDDHTALGRQPDPADRRARRPALPRGRRAACRTTSAAASTSAARTC